MTSSLDLPETLSAFSESLSRESIHAFPEQCLQTFQDASRLAFPETYRSCKNIVVTGMGGSAIGAHVVRSVFADALRVPFLIIEGYDLPAFVDQSTLVICVSYSGGTEEALAAYQEARRRGCPMVAVAAGGELIQRATQDSVPHIAFHQTNNPSNMPRMGVGLTLGAELGILAALGFLSLDDRTIADALTTMREQRDTWSPDVLTQNNLAKQLALAVHGRMPMLVASEHLAGNMILARNQIHENAKTFAEAVLIPDINHHLMEGLAHPSGVPYVFLFFTSNLYHPRNQKRFPITEAVVKEQGFPTHIVNVPGDSKLKQALNVLQLLGFVSYYASLLNNVNPALIPWVDSFKKQLSS